MMKERILRVLMFFAIAFAIGVTILGVLIDEGAHTVVVTAVFGVVVISIASAIQYIAIGEWHPTHLFKKKSE